MQDLDFIVKRNRECLIRFGITNFDHQLIFFRQVLERIGVEQILRWRDLLLELVYWPRISLGPSDNHWGWKVRPNSWFFKQASAGLIFHRDQKGRFVGLTSPWILQRGAYLVDTRQKPGLQVEGSHMWAEDENFLGVHLRELRKNYHTYRKEFLSSSRFCINRHILKRIKQILTQTPEFQAVKFWRSERASEFNFIAQCYPFMPRRWDGETDTNVLFDEVDFGGGGGNNYLTGGSCEEGGLADISHCYIERLESLHLSLRLIGILELEGQV